MMEINGKAYRTNLQGTLQIKVIRRVKREFGYSWPEITNWLEENMTADTLIGEAICEDQFLAWMWAWILNAGDEMTRAELEALTLADINFTTVDEQPETGDAPALDPTSARTDSDPGDANAQGAGAAQPRKRSTPTSKKQSSPASS